MRRVKRKGAESAWIMTKFSPIFQPYFQHHSIFQFLSPLSPSLSTHFRSGLFFALLRQLLYLHFTRIFDILRLHHLRRTGVQFICVTLARLKMAKNLQNCLFIHFFVAANRTHLLNSHQLPFSRILARMQFRPLTAEEINHLFWVVFVMQICCRLLLFFSHSFCSC